jgi:Ig-like domain from next to BRCA1 gene
MNLKHKYIPVTIITILAFTLGACGSSASNNSIIATSVAMTVQAQNTQQAQFSPTPSITDLPPIGTPPTADAVTPAPPTAPPPGSNGSKFCTASATFVSETVPDGTIEMPGAQFLKTWSIMNSGTCAWDSSWKLVFVSGDVMGGAFVYNFPQPAAPGQTVNVPVVLFAPTANGSYTGYWKIQSPWGTSFGDSGSGNPFWVKIVVGNLTPVNHKTATVFDITSLTYNVVRVPTLGCPANVDYETIASITTDGPVTIDFRWFQYDGNDGSDNNSITFTDAATKTWVHHFKLHLGSTINPRWVQFVEIAPTYHEFGKSFFTYDCH